MATVLKIYISENCWGCVEARKIADEVRVGFSEVHVQLVEHDAADEVSWPDSIIATPTYELNGKIVSLGNPYREELHSLISEAVGQSRKMAT